MIKSFKHNGLKKFFYKGDARGIQPKHVQKLKYCLQIIHAASEINDINFPGSGLHLLEPKKNQVWALSVNGNWRITFQFKEGDAYILDYVDYH